MTCDDWHECVRFLFKSISTLSIHADGFLRSIRVTQRISKLIIVRKQILMEQTNADQFSHEEWTQKHGFSSRSCWLSRSETQITVFVPQTVILALFSLNDVLLCRHVTLTAMIVDHGFVSQCTINYRYRSGWFYHDDSHRGRDANHLNSYPVDIHIKYFISVLLLLTKTKMKKYSNVAITWNTFLIISNINIVLQNFKKVLLKLIWNEISILDTKIKT